MKIWCNPKINFPSDNTPDKPIKWDKKSFLVCDSDNDYICNAEIYIGRRDDTNFIPNLEHGGLP